MPYIIVVNKRGCLPETEPKVAADLDAAREMAREEIRTSMNAYDADDDATRYDFERCLESVDQFGAGGAIISMPDGYVIDVNTISWQAIAKLTGYEHRYRSARGPDRREVQESILDAYNVGAPE